MRQRKIMAGRHVSINSCKTRMARNSVRSEKHPNMFQNPVLTRDGRTAGGKPSVLHNTKRTISLTLSRNEDCRSSTYKESEARKLYRPRWTFCQTQQS